MQSSVLLAVAFLGCFSIGRVAATEIRSIAGNGAKGDGGDRGPAASAQVSDPTGLCRGPGGLYFCDTDNHKIRRIDPDGTITTVAGNGSKGYSGDGGPATNAQLSEPYEVRFDAAGNMYIVERLNHTVRKVDVKTGTISTLVGTGQAGFAGDGGPASKAQLKEPHSIGLDAAGNLYICDTLNHRVRRVDSKTQTISTYAGTGEKRPAIDGVAFAGAALSGPRALDFDKEENLCLALREGNAVYRLEAKSGKLKHLAGTGKQGFTGNGGPAVEASLSGPKGLAVAPTGDIYLADTESHSIRMIDLHSGNLVLVAGTGKKGDGPEGDPLNCALNRPHGVFVDKDGTIFIGDSGANRVRALKK